MTEEDILRRVRSLLALSTSNNENEAASAAAKAQELLIKYNLDASMLGSTTAKKEEDIEQKYSSLDEADNIQSDWKSRLAFAVAQGNLCELVIIGSRRRVSGDTRQLCWIGTPSNIAVAQYTYEFFARELERIADDKWKQVLKLKNLQKANPSWEIIGSELLSVSPAKWKTSFYFGAVKGIREKLIESKQQMQNANSNLNALIVLNDNALQEFKRRAFPYLTSIGPGAKDLYNAAFNSGQSVGKTLNTREGISAGGTHAVKRLGPGN
jgi:hypothetical protein